MKKWMSLLVAAVLASMVMVGCQSGDTTTDPNAPAVDKSGETPKADDSTKAEEGKTDEVKAEDAKAEGAGTTDADKVEGEKKDEAGKTGDATTTPEKGPAPEPTETTK